MLLMKGRYKVHSRLGQLAELLVFRCRKPTGGKAGVISSLVVQKQEAEEVAYER